MPDDEELDMEGRLEPTIKFHPNIAVPLKPLIDKKENAIILGRSGGAHKKSGMENLMNLGVITERQLAGDNHYGMKVFADAEFPHVIFVCGKRGSGKSYSLGILAEELASQGTGIGVVIIDPIGIFWSMKRANKNRPELTILKKWGMEPKAFENVNVLAPIGYYHDMANTCDGPFALNPMDLSAEDWCQMFDIDRFKAQGLLIGDAIDKVRRGYEARVGKSTMEVPGSHEFSLGDLVQCINNDVGITSKDEGYAPPTRRSVVARLKAAARWGIFSTYGTMIGDISVPNQVTVLDVSHPKLGDERRSLVVGILARKILENRIETSRSEDAQSMGVDTRVKTNIPVTWLLIDEAHLMIPHSRDTVASSSLIEYAKLGRKPGCGLVLATQRPAATNDDILSQVDLLIGHNLALEDDMTALRRRVPSKVPSTIADSDFIRSLPVGAGIVADQKTQERTMVLQFRPRYTHHSGKAAKPKGKIVQDPLQKRQAAARPEAEGATVAAALESKGIEVSDPEIKAMVEGAEVYKPTYEMPEPEEEMPEEPEEEFPDGIDTDGDGKPDKPKPEFLPGNTYLIYSQDADQYFFQYMKYVKGSECPAVVLSRAHPDKLKQRYPQLESEFYWLSNTSGQNCISPNNLQEVMTSINQFVKTNEGAAVILDGLEYLSSNNDFQKILAMVQAINEKVVLNKAVFLIPVDPTALDAQQRGVLEKEVDFLINLGPEILDEAEKMRRDLENFSKDRLVDLCRKRGLKISGSKDDLMNRLIGTPETIPEALGQAPKEDLKSKLEQEMEAKLKKQQEEQEKEYKRRLEELEREKKLQEAEEAKERKRQEAEEARERKRIEAEEAKELKEAKKQMEAEARKLEKLRLQIEREKEKEEELKAKQKAKEEEEARIAKIKAAEEAKRQKHLEEIRKQEEELAKKRKEIEMLKKQQKELEQHRIKVEREKKKAEAERERRLKKEQAEKERERKRAETLKKKLEMEKARQQEKLAREKAKRDAKAKAGSEKQKEDGPVGLVIKNRVSGFQAAKKAEKEIKHTLLGKKKEVMDEVVPKYVELYRFRVKALKGISIFAKETVLYLVWDNFSEEIVTDFKKGLVRTQGAGNLMGLTQNQIRVLTSLSGRGTEVEKAAKRSKFAPGDTKRSLGQLVSKNLVKKKFDPGAGEDLYFPTFVMELDDDCLYKEDILPTSGTSSPSKEILTRGHKPKEVEKFLENYIPTMKVMDHQVVYYPFFVATMKGKDGKRRVFVDAATGRLDKHLSEN